MLIQTISGADGEVSIKGLGAVIAIVSRYTLKRRRSEPNDGPASVWDLSADLSYAKDAALANPSFKKVVKVKTPFGSWKEVRPEPGVELRIVHGRLMIEGATLCPAEGPR